MGQSFGRAFVAGAVIAATLGFVGCGRPYVEDEGFTLDAKDIYGNPVSLSDERYQGKVVLVDLWGTWCPPCLNEIPHLVDWQKRYGEHGFEIIGVEFASYIGDSREDYLAHLRTWVEEQGINYPIIQGGETTDVNKVFPELRNFAGFPTGIFIDRKGEVRAVKSGFLESEVTWYESTIKKLLSESDSKP